MSQSTPKIKTISPIVLIKSLIMGSVAGCITVAFRLLVTTIFDFAQGFATGSKDNFLHIIFWFLFIIIAFFIVARLLKWEPMITGSGIPQMEGELKGLFNQHPLKILIGKFIGGVIALGAGLSLGREGPCIQMGAVVGKGFARKNDTQEKDLLMTSGGAAGLAAAFGAPIGGILFALEEVHKSFNLNILFTAIAACATSGIITQLLLGPAPIFDITITRDFTLPEYGVLILLGIFLGFLGAFYNTSVNKMQQGYSRMKKIPSYYRLIFPFIAAGILVFVFPSILGGGDSLVGEIIQDNYALLYLCILLLAKLLFSVFSFSSGVPGGILMPTLVMGAVVGGVFATFLSGYLGINDLMQNFIVCAMAGLFGAIVRAPLTGIMLVCEMTGAYSQLLPLVVTTLTACIIAELLKSRPIYDQLLDHDIHYFN
ncbi:ClC family H(+)/Cl(-) exchange transporter [Christensenella tenuis]|uniref:ClC family H(+)/Cl(-) exchange transporter n=1 Tax=Christensenella tenuis TaxID=2763033 RepID=A0ABR7EE57_9FIRM|nr:ClC family H(+)/Cl(-) exchange transporter [Christensenella tenuis]MBC5648063.1 ClC family H(+)/Cl(-) exchange transporter [Christensenella tenuis]